MEGLGFIVQLKKTAGEKIMLYKDSLTCQMHATKFLRGHKYKRVNIT
jgi:hypothetical protein